MSKIYNYKIRIGELFRQYIRNNFDRIRLKNSDFSIISNHCIGGIIYHDLGEKFLSPTVNLKILPDDFIKFIENLEYYLALSIEKVESDLKYPVGKLGDITIYFVHYKSFDQAVSKWNERKKRINFDNIYYIMTVCDGCADETLSRFDKINGHKVVFANESHPDIKSCHWARLDSGKPLPGYISDIINVFGKRAFQCNGFDYIKFLNQKN